MEGIHFNHINIAEVGRNWLRLFPRLTVWGILIFFILFFLADALGKYSNVTPNGYGPFWENRFWLILHIVGGTLTLLIGPLQFSRLVRENYGRLHKALGRTYVFGVTVGALGSIYLSTHSVVGWMFGTMLFFATVVWVVSTAMGIISISNGRRETHRHWMIRSYVTTCGFVLFRLLTMTGLFAGAEIHERFATLGWLSFVVPMAVVEFCFSWRSSLRQAN